MKKTCLIYFLTLSCFLAHSQDKKFNWIPWNKVSPEIKTKLKKMKSYSDETVYQEIVSQLEFGGTASLAVIDLDGDGEPEYAVGYGGSINCGSLGCSFAVFDNDGKKKIDLTDTWERIKPVKNGVISSTGKFFALRTVK